MRRSTPPTISSDLPRGDWHHLSRRQEKEALENTVRLEFFRFSTPRNY